MARCIFSNDAALKLSCGVTENDDLSNTPIPPPPATTPTISGEVIKLETWYCNPTDNTMVRVIRLEPSFYEDTYIYVIVYQMIHKARSLVLYRLAIYQGKFCSTSLYRELNKIVVTNCLCRGIWNILCNELMWYCLNWPSNNRDQIFFMNTIMQFTIVYISITILNFSSGYNPCCNSALSSGH